MKIAKEFKEFAMRGNVVDMAVGIIIGGAFGKIVSSLVNDVIMPPIGYVLGGVDFTSLAITVRNAGENAGAVTLRYGLFINTVIDFLIVAGAIFFAIKVMNKIKRNDKQNIEDKPEKECPYCVSRIPQKAVKCRFCGSELL